MALISTKAMVYEGQDPHGRRFFKVIEARATHGPLWQQLNRRWLGIGEFSKPGKQAHALKTSLVEALRKLDASPDLTFSLPLGHPGSLNIYVLEDLP